MIKRTLTINSLLPKKLNPSDRLAELKKLQAELAAQMSKASSEASSFTRRERAALAHLLGGILISASEDPKFKKDLKSLWERIIPIHAPKDRRKIQLTGFWLNPPQKFWNSDSEDWEDWEDPV